MKEQRQKYEAMRAWIRSAVREHNVDIVARELLCVRQHARAYEVGDAQAVMQALDYWGDKRNLIRWSDLEPFRLEICAAIASDDDMVLAIELSCLNELAAANVSGDAARVAAAWGRWEFEWAGKNFCPASRISGTV